MCKTQMKTWYLKIKFFFFVHSNSMWSMKFLIIQIINFINSLFIQLIIFVYLFFILIIDSYVCTTSQFEWFFNRFFLFENFRSQNQIDEKKKFRNFQFKNFKNDLSTNLSTNLLLQNHWRNFFFFQTRVVWYNEKNFVC